MIHLIWAEDEFLAAELVERFLAKAGGDGEEMILVPEGGDLPGLEEALFSPSLFASARYVVIKEAERLNRSGLERLAEAAGRGEAAAEVAVVAVSERQPAALIKALGDTAKLHKAPRPRRGQLVAWVQKRLVGQGLKPREGAAGALVAAVGEGLRDLAQAVDQLALRKGQGGTVSAEDVREHFPGAAEQPVWALFDAVVRRDAAASYRLLATLTEHGDDPIPLLFALLSQVRMVMRAKALLEGAPQASDADIAKSLGVSSGRAPILRRQAHALSWEWLLGAHEAAAEADVDLKGGEEGAALPPGAVLERFLAKVLKGVPTPSAPR